MANTADECLTWTVQDNVQQVSLEEALVVLNRVVVTLDNAGLSQVIVRETAKEIQEAVEEEMRVSKSVPNVRVWYR
jgi:hypothetical protein